LQLEVVTRRSYFPRLYLDLSDEKPTLQNIYRKRQIQGRIESIILV